MARLNKQNLAQEIETGVRLLSPINLKSLNKQNLAQEIETGQQGGQQGRIAQLEQTESRSRD